MNRQERNAKRGTLLVALVCVVAAIANSVILVKRSSGIDFFHFWIVPRLVESGAGETGVYSRARRDVIVAEVDEIAQDVDSPRVDKWAGESRRLYPDGLHPTATPLLYATHGSLQTRNVEFDFMAFQAAGIAVFLMGCLLIGEACGLPLATSLLIAGLLLLFHRGVHSDIGVANVNRFQAGMFAVAFGWIARWRTGDGRAGRLATATGWILAGVILGWMIGYKPNTLLAAILPGVALLFDRRWSCALLFLIGGVAGGVAGLEVGARYMGGVSWLEWRDYVAEVWHEPFALEAGNYALSRLLNDPALKSGSAILSAILIVAMLVWMWRTRAANRPSHHVEPERAPGRYARLAAAGLVVPLISGPVTWGHYLVLSIPLAIIVAARMISDHHHRSFAWMIVASMAIGLTALLPTTWIPGLGATWTLVSIQSGLAVLLFTGLDDHPREDADAF